jgi:hypothetical protein
VPNNGGDQIPVSLKRFSTPNMAHVRDVLFDNREKIGRVKLPGPAVIHCDLTTIDSTTAHAYVTGGNAPMMRLTNNGLLSLVRLECRDGVVDITPSGVTLLPRPE